MSAENVEIVRRGYEQWLATGEFLLEHAAPDFVWDMSTFQGWPERQTYPGIEGARQFIADWAEAWETWELPVEGHIDGCRCTRARRKLSTLLGCRRVCS